MFCQNCGAQLRVDARFCHVCGAEQLPEEYSDTSVSSSPVQETAPVAVGAENPAPIEPKPAIQEDSGRKVPVPQPLTGTFTWENVKISGEFQNGVGSITITFQ